MTPEQFGEQIGHGVAYICFGILPLIFLWFGVKSIKKRNVTGYIIGVPLLAGAALFGLLFYYNLFVAP